MLRCVECSEPVTSLYQEYSKGNLKLTQCVRKGTACTDQQPSCKQFADKYIEFDNVIIAIDVILLKPQVYRHLLFNTYGTDDDRFDRQVRNLAVLILLSRFYTLWMRLTSVTPVGRDDAAGGVASSLAGMEAALGPGPQTMARAFVDALQRLPHGAHYLVVLGLSALELLAMHTAIRIGVARVFAWPRPNVLSMALILSSMLQVFPVVMVIWSYYLPALASTVEWATIINGAEAIRSMLFGGRLALELTRLVLLECPFWKALAAILAGRAVQSLIIWAVLALFMPNVAECISMQHLLIGAGGSVLNHMVM